MIKYIQIFFMGVAMREEIKQIITDYMYLLHPSTIDIRREQLENGYDFDEAEQAIIARAIHNLAIEIDELF